MRGLATTGDGAAALVDAPMPVPGSGEVLVRVDAATINELEGTTYAAVFDAAPLQFDDQLFKAVVLPCVAPGGTFCSVLALFPIPEVPDATAFAIEVKPDGPILASLLGRAAAGELTCRIAGTVPLERAGNTLQSAFASRVRGRWIVQPSPSS